VIGANGRAGCPPEAVLRPLAALLAAVALPALVGACGGSGGDGDAGGADSVTAGAADTTTAADTAPDDDPRPLRAFRFRIGNATGDTAMIVADAGAGTRTLDTVPPADSGEVRVETRASLLELLARSGSGVELARSRYDLERPAGDTLLDFELFPPSSTADSTGG